MEEDEEAFGQFRIVRASMSGHDVGGPVPKPGLATPDDYLMMFTADWHPVQVVNRFLWDVRYRPKRSGNWQNTQRASIQDLVQWWMFLSVNEIRWDRAVGEDLSDYANTMAVAVSISTGLQFSTSTVARRIGTVETFYDWAYRKGLVADLVTHDRGSGSPISVAADAISRPWTGTATLERVSQGRPRGRDPDSDPRPLSMDSLRAVLAKIGDPIFAADDTLLTWPTGCASRRNRLMAEVAFHTGMRIGEVASIKVREVVDIESSIGTGSPWRQFTLTVKTKGKPARKVVVTALLVKALALYGRTERQEAIERAKEAAESEHRRYQEPAELFLNGIRSNLRDVGRAVGVETASRAFTDAVLKCGMIRHLDGFELDHETGDKLYDADGKAIVRRIPVAAHTFHDLRHTFAVMTYGVEAKLGNKEPWLKVKNRLGHASVETTRNTYLAFVGLDEASISDAAAHRMRMGMHAAR